MKKQTAVEWLVEQIEQYMLTHGNIPHNVLWRFKKQAKAMEAYAEQERLKGITEGFNAAREIELETNELEEYHVTKYPDVTDYLNSKP